MALAGAISGAIYSCIAFKAALSCHSLTRIYTAGLLLWDQILKQDHRICKNRCLSWRHITGLFYCPHSYIYTWQYELSKMYSGWGNTALYSWFMVSQTWLQYLFLFQAVHCYYCSLWAALDIITKLLLEKKWISVSTRSFAGMQPELDWAEDALYEREDCPSLHQSEQWCRETPFPCHTSPLCFGWTHFASQPAPSFLPNPGCQPQLLAVRALKTNGNVAQSLGRDDKLAQRAPYIPRCHMAGSITEHEQPSGESRDLPKKGV